MVDLHSHTVFSDGELIPYELARRAEAAGYRVLGITDHVDASNIDFVIPRLVAAVRKLEGYLKLRVVAGAEITHVPPGMVRELVQEARALGAGIVVVHGETLVEPVAPGTNRAAIEAGADILAHPGLITEEDAKLAASKGVALEITARKGHSLSNGHVAMLGTKAGARLVLNTDAHAPGDLITREFGMSVLMGAGLGRAAAMEVMAAGETIAEKALRRT